jgi:hypothetical protein
MPFISRSRKKFSFVLAKYQARRRIRVYCHPPLTAKYNGGGNYLLRK